MQPIPFKADMLVLTIDNLFSKEEKAKYESIQAYYENHLKMIEFDNPKSIQMLTPKTLSVSGLTFERS